MPTKSCNCIALAGKKLEPHNTRLIVSISLTGACDRAVIATERIKSLRDNKRPLHVVATYCPFCGKKYPEEKKKV